MMSTIRGTKLILNVPPELAGYEAELERAFGAAIYKLAKNAKKGKWEDLDLSSCLRLLKQEVEELSEAVDHGNTMDMVMECADVINFSMMTVSIAINRGQHAVVKDSEP